jgi:hypothetical protein
MPVMIEDDVLAAAIAASEGDVVGRGRLPPERFDRLDARLRFGRDAVYRREREKPLMIRPAPWLSRSRRHEGAARNWEFHTPVIIKYRDEKTDRKRCGSKRPVAVDQSVQDFEADFAGRSVPPRRPTPRQRPSGHGWKRPPASGLASVKRPLQFAAAVRHVQSGSWMLELPPGYDEGYRKNFENRSIPAGWLPDIVPIHQSPPGVP